ncbi:hypothetical protein MAHJHV59_36440 [Mycobacterium avium subsp. hominissuis]
MGAIRLPLRRRSGSLIAPIALHWSLNGLGALADLSAGRIAGAAVLLV